MFSQSAALSKTYIDLKYGSYTKEDCKSVMKQAIEVIEGCKQAKSDIYNRRPVVHGVSQQSRLDLLDIWQGKAEAVYDNVMDMMNKAL